MSKQLREHSRAALSYPEISGILEGLENLTDRELAIIGGAIIEGTVKELLSNKLIGLSSDDKKNALDEYGVFGNFGAMITVMAGFKFLHKDLCHDLKLIKELRNSAAHARREFSFELPSVASMAQSFMCTNRFDELAKSYIGEHSNGCLMNEVSDGIVSFEIIDDYNNIGLHLDFPVIEKGFSSKKKYAAGVRTAWCLTHLEWSVTAQFAQS